MFGLNLLMDFILMNTFYFNEHKQDTWKCDCLIGYIISINYKGWLVTNAFTQTHGIDYTKTFSLVICMNSIKALLSLEVIEDSSLH